MPKRTMRRSHLTATMFKRQKGLCYYCYAPMTLKKEPLGSTMPSNLATIDHRIPKSKGGKWVKSNLVLCCYECNTRKGDYYDREEK
jgi:5-methylcytosine-specific restriction endonuclease McrA